MIPAQEEAEEVLTDGYRTSPRQLEGDSAGDRPDDTKPVHRHSVIPAGKKGKRARKRSNKQARKKADRDRGEGERREEEPRPALQEAATRAAEYLRSWAIHNGWVPSRAKRRNESSRPRPAACWLVALDGMARGMLSLWDVWVATVKEGVFSGRPAVDCLSVPHYAGRGDASGAMGISPAVVVSALRYRYASWAFRHVGDFRVVDHPRQFPKAF